jgi:DNA repair photolyase
MSYDAPVIREVACKTVLNRSALGEYSLNCYTGCAHGCAYCYARFMQRFHPHDETWGAFVDVKINAVETLKRQLRRAAPGSVFLSSACDAWQPAEADYRLTRRCCELLLERGFSIHALTKSKLIVRDLDVLAAGDASVGVTITTPDERLARLWEPGAASVAERWRVIDEAQRRGLRTCVMFGPLLPQLSDGYAELESLMRAAAAHGVETIWVDALNPRPRVWPAVAELLRRRFPELHEFYRRMLFDRRVRAAYMADLARRVAQAAAAAGLGDRVQTCVATA